MRTRGGGGGQDAATWFGAIAKVIPARWPSLGGAYSRTVPWAWSIVEAGDGIFGSGARGATDRLLFPIPERVFAGPLALVWKGRDVPEMLGNRQSSLDTQFDGR